MNKSKYVWGSIVIIALVFAGYLWYQGSAKRNAAKDRLADDSATSAEKQGAVNDISDMDLLNQEGDDPFADGNFNATCENGEWVKAEDVQGEAASFSGKLRKVYPDDEASKQFKNYIFFLESASSVAIVTQKPVTLSYFEDREVELKGVKAADKNEVNVSEIRCAGKETDKNLIGKRTSLMNFVAANISNISPQKAKFKNWTVDIVDFVDESNIYVEYYDSVEDSEDSNVEEDTARKVLLETSSKSGGGYEAKVLAYWEMGEDDYVLKQGTDKFENVDEVTTYQYDPEERTWERIN